MVNEDLKKTLKSLCMSHGWSYAVFWRFDPHNPMVLTMEDAYSEEHATSVISSMLLQAHKLGEGIIGQVALDGKHKWMYADAISWDVSEFGLQFSSGIKTIAVVPLELQGVVQLGSVHKISETLALVDQVKSSLLGGLRVVPGVSICSLLNSDATGQYELLGSLSSSSNSLCGDVSTSWANQVGNVETSSLFNLLNVQLEPYTQKTGDDNGDGKCLTDYSFGSLAKNTEDLFEEQFIAADFPSPTFGALQMDDLTQWLDDSSELCVSSLNAMLSDDTPHTLEVDGLSSVLDDGFYSIQEDPACSMQSFCGNTVDSCGELDAFVVNANNDALFPEVGENMGFETFAPHPLAFQNGAYKSGVEGPPVTAPRKGLFSELGLEHLLRDDKGAISSSSAKSCIDDQWPPSKRRRVESYQTINSHIRSIQPSWEAKSMQSSCIGGHVQDLRSLKELVPKSQAGLSVHESYKSCISTVNSQSRKTNEPAEPVKKRAKPGQSKKPRPKDRQQIAERLNELRDLIPNGAKLSIDALLGQTMKHLDFLQNLTKHAGELKQVHEPKLIGHGNGLVSKSNSNGATWAFEVGGSNIICPIIVEDLGHPCQMLIEMLCEEREYFLEMADIVKGFGLTILKGMMEERDNNIWAQFTVEAKKPVERVQVFMSLMQIFQCPTTTEELATIELEKLNNCMPPMWGDFQQNGVQISI